MVGARVHDLASAITTKSDPFEMTKSRKGNNLDTPSTVNPPPNKIKCLKKI